MLIVLQASIEVFVDGFTDQIKATGGQVAITLDITPDLKGVQKKTIRKTASYKILRTTVLVISPVLVHLPRV